MKNNQCRQGDVLIERVQEVIRKSSKNKKLKSVVLAEGEATGHAHVLRAQDGDFADWWKQDGHQFASITAPAVVVHEEHKSIELERGTYKITRQREYTQEAIRHVAD